MNERIQIKNSIEYIEKHLCESIKLDQIAKQSFFSEFHFHRLFHKSVGSSVMKYVQKRRLHEAAKELSESDKKITDIAFKYQFGSQESFSRAFKKQFGMSPREYRKNFRVSAICKKENVSIKRVNTPAWRSSALCRAA